MDVVFSYTGESPAEMNLCFAYETKKEEAKGQPKTKSKEESPRPNLQNWKSKELVERFFAHTGSSYFAASSGQSFPFYDEQGQAFRAVGLGKKEKFDNEKCRRAIARVMKDPQLSRFSSLGLHLDHIGMTYLRPVLESIFLSIYQFNRYKSKSEEPKLKKVYIYLADKGKNTQHQKLLSSVKNITQCISLARDLGNMAPNHLHSEEYAKILEKDARATLKGVKIKILDRVALKKEKMDLFLSVNTGSAFEPRLVHLSYRPSRVTSSTKHIALVGKGITFDTGGHSLKPAASMKTMKFDMCGSATVYAAFRAAVLEKSPHILTCIMPMTDNAIGPLATFPDAIIKARNGKTVEILNTDAEGRLILADALDYACDLEPDAIIDAATLTGAVLVALGNQVCGLMANNQSLAGDLLKAAKAEDEYLWQLPLIEEYTEMMKSKVADLGNIPQVSGTAGTVTAGAFLQEFIKNDIPWAHLDIAGVASDQSHLPYCPSHGGSGVMVRTLVRYLCA